MHVNHASHSLFKIQYDHASNLGIYVRVLKKLFVLSKHGTKANIRSTKMTNNRHAYNRNVLQSYWTSEGLLLCCSQPTGEKTNTNQQCERHLIVTTGHCSVWLDGCHSQPVPYSNNTGFPIDVCQQE